MKKSQVFEGCRFCYAQLLGLARGELQIALAWMETEPEKYSAALAGARPHVENAAGIVARLLLAFDSSRWTKCAACGIFLDHEPSPVERKRGFRLCAEDSDLHLDGPNAARIYRQVTEGRVETKTGPSLE